MDKTIRRVVDVAEQDAENYRYWQGLSIGERIVAISEMSAGAYAAEGVEDGHGARPARVLVRVEREREAFRQFLHVDENLRSVE